MTSASPTSATFIQRTQLSNGLIVVTERMPHVRSISIGLWLRSGSRRESATENGITHFIEHMLFKGTTTRSAEEIARSVDSIGGNLDAFTAKETVCFSAKVLDEHLPIALDVLADLVQHPLFRAEDIDRERGVILQEIKMDEDNPDYLVHELFTQNFWQEHALGRPILGTKETMRAMQQPKLLRYYDECFTGGNLVFSAAGNLEHEEVVAQVARRFEPLKTSSNGHRDVPPRNHARIVLRNKKQLEQVQVCLGLPSYPIVHQQRYAWSVLNTVAGGGMSSRFFQNIRERQGLAYSVYSDLSPYRDAGVFSVFAGTSASSVRQVVHSIVQELRDFRDRLIPPEELRRAKDNLKGSLMLALESTGARMSNLARQELYFGRYTDLDETIARIEAVTAEEIQALARECFLTDRLALAVLGNLNGLKITRDDLRIEAN